MKKIIILAIISVFLYSCEKEKDMKRVKYLVTDSVSGFTVTYTNEDGEKQAPMSVAVGSEEDEWTMSFMAEQGQVVYLSVEDTVTNSFTRLQIYVDGKVYKQGVKDDKSPNVVVSGVVPFN